jgi:hypothetical protein
MRAPFNLSVAQAGINTWPKMGVGKHMRKGEKMVFLNIFRVAPIPAASVSRLFLVEGLLRFTPNLCA